MCARTDVDVLNTGADERRRQLVQRMRRLVSGPRSPSPPPPAPAHEPQVPLDSLDTLALVTAHQRKLLDVVYDKLDLLRQHPAFSVMLRTTQPAHALMVAAVLLVSSSLMQLSATPGLPSTIGNLVYLAAFSIHLGNQFWMTFVSGLALYFNLPRHHFGAVQKILFPKYFSINSFLSLVSLISFTKLHHFNSIQTSEIIQVAVLSSCFLTELSMRLYLVPPVLEQISLKTELEVAAGVGREVGRFSPGPLLRCPHYNRVRARFRRLHAAIAAGNVVTMACSAAHLYYIAQHWICQVI